MRLSKIKLAGFKSFVDPTNVALPGQLIGVVGPNGCGKSNIIDAVRWVMGESSAKHLRGDSMADVIFNGSTARKPVGQASIELVFDNSDGTVAGQFARFNEISVRRQVTRDGQSSYFLNGTRCRRRDITDLFLGTGLGPRSYAIIEQGMISRFIEAKPEELRVFIEEAAGISKYKERRRETENRIRHTHDNLSRLSDLRDELEKQIQRLQRQARTAERYKELKQEERQLKAELLALRWRGYEAEVLELNRKLADKQTAYEASVAQARQIETGIEQHREQHVEASEAFNEVQARYYAVGSEIGRIQQALQHMRESREQLERELKRAEQVWRDSKGHLDADHEQLRELVRMLGEFEPELLRLRAAEEQSRDTLNKAEAELAEWQGGWEQFNQRASEPARAAEVDRTRIQHLEHQLEQQARRRNRLQEEQRGFDVHGVEAEIEDLNRQLLASEAEEVEQQQALQANRARIGELRESVSGAETELHQSRAQHSKLQGRKASLEALQQNALGKSSGAVRNWLKQRGLADSRRLAEVLRVVSGWERAAERVLAPYLDAIGVDDLGPLAPGVHELDKGELGLIETAAAPSAALAEGVLPRLSDMVSAEWALGGLLYGIYVAEDLSQALAVRERLVDGESVVTRDGVWLGARWLQHAAGQQAESGVLQREQELRDLVPQLERVAADMVAIQERLDRSRLELREQEEQLHRQQESLNAVRRRHAGIQSQLGARQAKVEQMRNRASRIQVELDEMQRQQGREEQQLSETRGRLEQTVARMAELDAERGELQQRRDGLRSGVENARRGWQQSREEAHRVALEVEGRRNRKESLQSNLGRIEEQVAQLGIRKQELAERLAESDAPLQESATRLEEKLSLRVAVEKDLQEARKAVEDVDTRLRELDQQRHRAEELIAGRRGEVEEARMAGQSVGVRRDTVKEQIVEARFALEELLEALEDGATESGWQEKVEAMERRITRLGPINLAAIEEFEQQSERKAYLDAQNDDLVEALTTLENAIRKIDRETRTRFKETFEKINTGLKNMFPRLFGGGHAQLELSDDDLLSAGVTIMARPPGKRNSSIHLLSGGEKALTAVALVFAIFELNPAPFCLLDEVDAPLDDANVSRFSALVKAMSERVQFLFVTHNKVTMEISDQLIGVTMNEPGVSRLVAVDVAEAAELAGAEA